MLSQVERGETSPTLAVAERSRPGSSCRFAAAAAGRGRRRQRRAGRASACAAGAPRGHRYEVLTPPLPGPARRGLAAHARARRGHRRSRRPADARAGQPRDRGRARRASCGWSATAWPTTSARATRSPSTPTCHTTSRTPAAATRASCRSSPPASGGAEHAQDPVREDLGGATRSRRAEPRFYIDLHLVHEVTSAAGVRGPAAGRAQGAPARPHARDRRPQRAHRRRQRPLDRSRDPLSREQVETLERNCAEFGITLYAMRPAARASCT